MFRRQHRAGLVLAGLAFGVAACAKKDPPPANPPVAVARDAAPVASPVSPADAASTDPNVIAGAALYGKYCALCHGPKAEGYAADNAPSLITPELLATASDAFLRDGIGRGRPGTAMAGYARAVGGPLDPASIDQLVAFLRNGKPAPATLPAEPIAGDLKKGAEVYAARCQECHGTPDVRGEAPHLANSIFLATASDAFIRHAIAFGRTGTKMPGFAGTLAESDIDGVVAFVRTWAKPDTLPTITDPTTLPADAMVLNPKGKAPTFTLRDGKYVSAEQVKKALDAKRKLVLVDARPPSDWNRMHINGAVSAPYYDLSSLDKLPTDGTWIIAYCACPHHESGVVVDELRKRGVKNSVVLDEGILFWQRKGWPVRSADGSPVPPVPKTPAHGEPGHTHDHGGHDHGGHDHGGHAHGAPSAPAKPPKLSPSAPNASPLDPARQP
jgi:cytochrome c oxidase cbb3-type subunit 3